MPPCAAIWADVLECGFPYGFGICTVFGVVVLTAVCFMQLVLFIYFMSAEALYVCCSRPFGTQNKPHISATGTCVQGWIVHTVLHMHFYFNLCISGYATIRAYE
jgi:hypothetical protein